MSDESKGFRTSTFQHRFTIGSLRFRKYAMEALDQNWALKNGQPRGRERKVGRKLNEKGEKKVKFEMEKPEENRNGKEEGRVLGRVGKEKGKATRIRSYSWTLWSLRQPTTGMFTCGKCKAGEYVCGHLVHWNVCPWICVVVQGNKTTYFQMQTRIGQYMLHVYWVIWWLSRFENTFFSY